MLSRQIEHLRQHLLGDSPASAELSELTGDSSDELVLLHAPERAGSVACEPSPYMVYLRVGAKSMLRTGVFAGVMVAVLVGCSSSRRVPKEAAPAAPAVTTTALAGRPDSDDASAARVDPKKRRAELAKRLRAAIELDGHPEGWQMTEAIAGCGGGGPKCAGIVTKVQRISETCFVGGQALHFLREGDLDEAEARLEQTEALAEKMGPTRREALAAQKATLAAAEECATDRAPCRTRCDQKNDMPACIAYGVALYAEDKKYADARVYLKRACDQDFGPSCNLLKDVDKVEAEETKNAAARVESAWSSLRAIGDDIATKRFLQAFASQNFGGRRNARASQMMAAHIQAMTTDYCAAKKEFLTVSNIAEFGRRSKAHCTDDAPTATGLSGKEETLTAQCHAVYATPCP